MTVYFVWASIYTLLVYFTTIWVVHTNAVWLPDADELAGIVLNKSINHTGLDHTTDLSDLTDSFLRGPNARYAAKTSVDVPLTQLLSNATSYSSFMQHLASEFNVESLLALTEFIQFQQLIWGYTKKHKLTDYK